MQTAGHKMAALTVMFSRFQTSIFNKQDEKSSGKTAMCICFLRFLFCLFGVVVLFLLLFVCLFVCFVCNPIPIKLTRAICLILFPPNDIISILILKR